MVLKKGREVGGLKRKEGGRKMGGLRRRTEGGRQS